jgi:hypothetical protein
MTPEGRENHPFWRRYHMHLSSPLTPEAEEVMTQTIGCATAVHRALGPGFLEWRTLLVKHFFATFVSFVVRARDGLTKLL